MSPLTCASVALLALLTAACAAPSPWIGEYSGDVSVDEDLTLVLKEHGRCHWWLNLKGGCGGGLSIQGHWLTNAAEDHESITLLKDPRNPACPLVLEVIESVQSVELRNASEGWALVRVR